MSAPVAPALFARSPRSHALGVALADFISARVLPAEAGFASWAADPATRWTPSPLLETLKAQAREAGLWNLFLPDATHGAGLSNLDYAPLAELMGRSLVAPEIFNCSAPDTGNMEVLAQFGSPQQQARWLAPLLQGEIRSAFAMTEPEVASSDAANIAMRFVRDGDHFVLDGRKWWTSGAGDPRCAVLIVMGVTEPDAEPYRRQSMLLVPMDTPGLSVRRPLGAHGMAQEAIALSRCEIEQARLLTLQAAATLDAAGNKGARDLVGMIKIVAPRMACAVIDRAIQLHGAGGLSQDHFLAHAYAAARSLRLADGPDEVHLAALARSMLKTPAA